MKKRMFALILVAALAGALFVGCTKNEAITQEQAQKIAIEHAGLTAEQVKDAHIHVTDNNGIPCYSVHITRADGTDLSILINAASGEVIG